MSAAPTPARLYPGQIIGGIRGGVDTAGWGYLEVHLMPCAPPPLSDRSTPWIVACATTQCASLRRHLCDLGRGRFPEGSANGGRLGPAIEYH